MRLASSGFAAIAISIQPRLCPTSSAPGRRWSIDANRSSQACGSGLAQPFCSRSSAPGNDLAQRACQCPGPDPSIPGTRMMGAGRPSDATARAAQRNDDACSDPRSVMEWRPYWRSIRPVRSGAPTEKCSLRICL